MKKFLMLVLLVGAVSTMSGCAVTKDYLTVDYSSSSNAIVLPGAENVNVKVDIVDNRDRKDRVSNKVNGYGMDMASIVAKNDVVKVISDAVILEVKSRGFKIADGNIVVKLDLSKFYNDWKIGMWSGSAVGEIVMMVQVNRADGNIVYSRLLNEAYTKKGCGLASGANAKISLDAVLQQAINKLMEDEKFTNALLGK